MGDDLMDCKRKRQCMLTRSRARKNNEELELRCQNVVVDLCPTEFDFDKASEHLAIEKGICPTIRPTIHIDSRVPTSYSCMQKDVCDLRSEKQLISTTFCAICWQGINIGIADNSREFDKLQQYLWYKRCVPEEMANLNTK